MQELKGFIFSEMHVEMASLLIDEQSAKQSLYFWEESANAKKLNAKNPINNNDTFLILKLLSYFLVVC